MTYATLMVHLEVAHPNASVLAVARALVESHEATVIGIAIGRELEVVYPEGHAAGDIFEQDLEDTQRKIGEAATQFRNALQREGTVLEWRGFVEMGPQASHLAHEARCADLLITGARSPDFFGTTRMVDCAELVLRSGRPVLVVPEALVDPQMGYIVVGWNDTREARRAVADALPMLRHAKRVTVVELAKADGLAVAQSHVDDVCAWLMRHGIAAEAVAHRVGEDESVLNDFAQQRGADLIVAGAYGHSRMGEWLFGGTTIELMRRAERCVLFSH